MKKSKILLFISIIFVFSFSSSFDFPRYQKSKRRPLRFHRYNLHSLQNGQSFRAGNERYSDERVIVKFKPTMSIQSIKTTLDAYQVKEIERIPALDIYLLDIPENSSVEEMIYALSLNPDVDHVSPDYKTHITAVPQPTDSLFNLQYYLHNTGQTVGNPPVQGIAGADIKALEAWGETTGDNQVVIAVIDTGIDFDHPELANTPDVEKILPNGYDYVNEDDDPTDDNGHGTFMSGLIAAKTNNDDGIAGVSWHSKILPIKAVASDGWGSIIDLAEAITHAADNGADVISMSLGFSLSPFEEAPALEAAVNYAFDKGVVLVASAGNKGSSVNYPAAYDNCMAVAATDSKDDRPTWSNFGPEVDVAAPGVDVVGPVPTWFPEKVWKDFTAIPYAYGDGTSSSTALVAGFAALIKSTKPWLTSAQIMDIIRYSADDINAEDHPGKDDYIGYGRIDTGMALVPIIITGSK